MTCCVLDGSTALAWVLPGEASAAGDALLDRVAAEGALVPGLWHLEVGNVLLAAERRGRITAAERRQALDTLAGLPLRADADTAGQAWHGSLGCAVAHRLTLYDACYLELALRRDLPLATLDEALRRAAAASDVALLGS